MQFHIFYNKINLKFQKKSKIYFDFSVSNAYIYNYNK